MTTSSQRAELSTELLQALRTLNIPASLAILQWRGLHKPEIAAALAGVALEMVEADPELAQRWLAIADALNEATGAQAAIAAQILYAQARLQVQRRQLSQAEQSLRTAQTLWQAAGDQPALARSHLGLTQILTMQGRYGDAENAIRQAITLLPPHSVQLAMAYVNLANLLDYQGEFAASLQTYTTARTILTQLRSDQAGANAEKIAEEIAYVDLNCGVVLISLDRPREAEQALLAALATFERGGDRLNRGRVRTNLGSLYLRTGRTTLALDMLNKAGKDLLGGDLLGMATEIEDLDTGEIAGADMLLLDQAGAYLVLNLLPEAIAILQRCSTLFRQADQRYEYSQTAYLLGLALLRRQEYARAEEALAEAQGGFARLENVHWCNRTALALATLAYETGHYEVATARLEDLLQLSATAHASADVRTYTGWDIGGLHEAWLLRLRLHLLAGELAPCRQLANRIAVHLQQISEETGVSFPHLRLQLEHALGCLEAATGNTAAALQHLQTAIFLLEGQRAALPLEEFKNAYLEDKGQIYSDLVLTLLREPTPLAVADAFRTVERARSRALLEKLLVSVERTPHTGEAATRAVEARYRLHWLYNQLLGEKGMRSVTLENERHLHRAEQTVQQLEWQVAWRVADAAGPVAEWQQAPPVDLAAFQRTLRPDQQALVYYVVEPSTLPLFGLQDGSTEGEVLAFVVDAGQIRTVRHLCTPAALRQARAELETGLHRPENVLRSPSPHDAAPPWQHTLAQLYQWLVAPLLPHLVCPRLLLIPHGPLHGLPFHLFWDGSHHLLEQFICAYVPSASVAMACGGADSIYTADAAWVGIAPSDPSIPNARHEVRQLARHFPQARIYLDEAATRQGLREAAAGADVLHIATHSLLRTDNPFFSALKLADGWLDVRELYHLSLNARLVVLSSCRSGLGCMQGGDELIGLARGFLAAGARSLLASLWDVDDSKVVAYIDDFYRTLLATLADPSAALRTVQLNALRRGDHPYDWASFFTIAAQ